MRADRPAAVLVRCRPSPLPACTVQRSPLRTHSPASSIWNTCGCTSCPRSRLGRRSAYRRTPAIAHLQTTPRRLGSTGAERDESRIASVTNRCHRVRRLGCLQFDAETVSDRETDARDTRACLAPCRDPRAPLHPTLREGGSLRFVPTRRDVTRCPRCLVCHGSDHRRSAETTTTDVRNRDHGNTDRPGLHCHRRRPRTGARACVALGIGGRTGRRQRSRRGVRRHRCRHRTGTRGGRDDPRPAARRSPTPTR